jgi:hypothetical protein
MDASCLSPKSFDPAALPDSIVTTMCSQHFLRRIIEGLRRI